MDQRPPVVITIADGVVTVTRPDGVDGVALVFAADRWREFVEAVRDGELAAPHGEPPALSVQ